MLGFNPRLRHFLNDLLNRVEYAISYMRRFSSHQLFHQVINILDLMHTAGLDVINSLV